jgi:hypothetical protein
MTKMKKILAGLYVGIMYVIVIGYMTSCTNHRRTERNTESMTPKGEITLYTPNGNDTTIVVSNFKYYGESETIVYYDMEGTKYYTTLIYSYRRYMK